MDGFPKDPTKHHNNNNSIYLNGISDTFGLRSHPISEVAQDRKTGTLISTTFHFWTWGSFFGYKGVKASPPPILINPRTLPISYYDEMTDTHVLRIPRTDEDGTFILVQVSSAGSKDLDVKLVATEGLAPYKVKLRHDRISTLKVKNGPCSEDEWERFLTAILLGRDSAPDIEAAAHVAEEDSITVTIRRRVQGITQRLGTLSLKYDEDEDIQLFEWCSTSVAAREAAKADLTSATARAEELESAVTELKNQLEELILAKQSDESVMLEKFRDLLNEKKVKIREQQRILASGNAGPAPAAPAAQVKVEAEDEEIAASSSRRAPKPSRPSKRKAAQAVEPEDDDAESDNAAEKMDVDKNQAEDDSEEEQTTDSDATGSEPDDDADDDEPPRSGKGQMPSRKKPSPEATRSRRQAPASAKTAGPSKKAADPPQAPPPKRSLPFGLGKAKKAAAPDEGSETDDDEL